MAFNRIYSAWCQTRRPQHVEIRARGDGLFDALVVSGRKSQIAASGFDEYSVQFLRDSLPVRGIKVVVA